MNIRPIQAKDEAAWRVLWAGYCKFYEVDIPKSVTDHTWARIMDPVSPVKAFVAEEDQGRGMEVMGMCNYIIHENTWTATPVCYLEDLFVSPTCRAKGVGQAMIDWLVVKMKANGWSRIYWNTKENNYRARGLYDKFTPRDPFVRYVIKNA